MRKIFLKLFSLVIFVLIFLFPKETLAIEDPLMSPNNIFGIHILNESELNDAANLVNSSGGDWGYVTIVIQKGERDTLRWQKAFDEARRLHLIPIVRIASAQQNSGWEKLNLDEIDGWVSFLNSLNWVVKNRYLVVGNEPNHAKEWGGDVNPKEYAFYLKIFSEKLKEKSSDFFILPAGLDFSAKNTKETMDAVLFLNKMLESDSDYFNYLDGWTSHSYPNPDFLGSEKAKGRGTIGSFIWELDYLKKLGLNKELPVFITETGWAHTANDGKTGIPESHVGSKFSYAFQNVWTDSRIVAVTPFLLNYNHPPFDVFSWKKTDGSFYSFYEEVRNLIKIRGNPKRINSVQILASFTPFLVGKYSMYNGALWVKNTGQTIINEDILISINSPSGLFETTNLYNYPNILPFHNSLLLYKLKSPKENGFYFIDLVLTKENEVISNKKFIKMLVFSLKDWRNIFHKISLKY